MMESLTYAQALTLRALTDTPRTPAQVKHDLPGRVPVATVRALLSQLRETGYASTAVSAGAKHPGIVAWVRTVPVNYFPGIVPVAAILAAGAEMGRRGLTSTCAQVEAWVGHALTDEQVAGALGIECREDD